MALVDPAGYDESVDEQAWLKLLHDSGIYYSFGSSLASMRPTIGGAGDRSVTIATGPATAKGSRIINDGPVVMNHEAVGSGSRWDLVVIRRNFTTNATSYAIIKGGSTKALPARAAGYPIDEQPVYLARVQQGSSTVQEIVDLRVFVNTGGAIALDVMALSYLDQLGARVEIDGVTYSHVVRSGVSQWVQSRSAPSPLSLFGVGPSQQGGAAPSSGLLVQAGSQIVTIDSSGYGRVTFPTPFPNGLLTWQPVIGDSRAPIEGYYVTAGWATTTGADRISGVFALRRPDGNRVAFIGGQPVQVRVNWIAIGW